MTQPYVFDPKDYTEYRFQGTILFRDLYEERLAGCQLGDIFVLEGDKNLSFDYATTGCLETHSEGGCAITLFPDRGLSLNENGLKLEATQLGLNTDNGSVNGSQEDVLDFVVSIRSNIGCGVASLANYTTNITFTVTWLNGGDISEDFTLPGGSYGLYPKIYSAMESHVAYAYALQEYITSSGEIWWIFLKQNKTTGKIISSYFAHDHPCFGNGNDPLLKQHPFGKIEPDEEIIVINPTNEQARKLKHLCRPQKLGERRKSPLEFIGEGKLFDIGKEEKEYPKVPVTIGIIDDEDMRPLWYKESAKIMQCIIPQPENVKVRNLHEYS